MLRSLLSVTECNCIDVFQIATDKVGMRKEHNKKKNEFEYVKLL